MRAPRRGRSRRTAGRARVGCHGGGLPGHGGERRAGRSDRHRSARVPPGASARRTGRPAAAGLPAAGAAAGEPGRGSSRAGRTYASGRRRLRPSAIANEVQETPAQGGNGPARGSGGGLAPAPAGRHGRTAVPRRHQVAALPMPRAARPRRRARQPRAGPTPAAGRCPSAAAARRRGAATRPRVSRSAARLGAAVGRRRQHDATPALGPAAAEINISAATEFNIDIRSAVRHCDRPEVIASDAPQ